MLLDRVSQSARALAVYDAYGRYMGEIGVIQVLVQMSDGFVHRHADQIDLGADEGGLGHFDLSASARRSFGLKRFCLSQIFQIVHTDLRAQYPHLHEQIAFGVGKGADRTFQIQAQHFDPVSDVQSARPDLFLRFLHGRLHAGFRGFDLFPKTRPLGFHFFGGDALAAEFMEIFHRFVGVLLCLAQDGVGLLVGFPENFLSLVVHAVLLFLEGVAQFADFFLIAGNIRLFPLQRDPAVLQLGDHVLKAFVLRADLLLRFFDQIFRKPQLLRDGERVALAGNADQQAVGRPQGFHVKFTAGILHAVGGKRIDFQLAVMGGRHRADSLTVQMVQNRDGQSRAFGRIGTGSQFIEEDQ